MMRRLGLLIGVIILFALPSSLADASGKPTRAPLPNSFNTSDFAPGLACSFELAEQPVVNNEFTTTFPPEANGDVVQLVTGYLLERLTNVGTGKSIIVNLSGPETIVFHADGSITFTGLGATIAIFFPTDIPAGPTAYINYGRYVETGTPSGQGILDSQSGTQFNVCAALS